MNLRVEAGIRRGRGAGSVLIGLLTFAAAVEGNGIPRSAGASPMNVLGVVSVSITLDPSDFALFPCLVPVRVVLPIPPPPPRPVVFDPRGPGLAMPRRVGPAPRPVPVVAARHRGTSAAWPAIARAALAQVGRPFGYAKETSGGRKGCAQVVSTILRRAGAVTKIRLRVVQVLSDLRSAGWNPVKPPPYRDGDVITWKTYDRTGDGKKDEDTHIGIVIIQVGTVHVVHNSSGKRRVVKQPLASVRYPVSRVMRKGGNGGTRS